MAAVGYRTCRRCHTPKLLEHFTADPTYLHGYRQVCKDCENDPKAARNRRDRATSLKKIKRCATHGEPYVGRVCKLCWRDRMREYSQTHKETAKQRRKAAYERDKNTPGWKERHGMRNKESNDRLRQRCFEAYGDRCYCCGLDDWRFLTIDHIWNDGHNHKYPNGRRRSGHKVYVEALAEIGSGRFRLACYNCNIGRAHRSKGGLCPHELDRLAKAKHGEAA